MTSSPLPIISLCCAPKQFFVHFRIAINGINLG
jgi:hypothetical protein